MKEENKSRGACYRCLTGEIFMNLRRGGRKIKPDTPFEEVSEDYRCPICKSKNAGFVPVK